MGKVIFVEFESDEAREKREDQEYEERCFDSGYPHCRAVFDGHYFVHCWKKECVFTVVRPDSPPTLEDTDRKSFWLALPEKPGGKNENPNVCRR